MLNKIDPQLFDWMMWRNGSPLDIFGVPLRPFTLDQIKPLLRRYVVGYCDAKRLVCRPKIGCKAVMFYKNDQYYWFHMMNHEFEYIFNH